MASTRLEHVVVVGEDVRDVPAAVELPDVVGVGRGGGDKLRAGRLPDALGVRVRHEPRANDANADGHGRL